MSAGNLSRYTCEYTVNSASNLYVSATPNNISNSYGIRPVISLKPTNVISSGDGTSTNPYVIQTN